MSSYINLTSYHNDVYRLAKIISNGYYSNVLYFEFHQPNNKEPVFESSRLDEFMGESEKYYESFICKSFPDEFEATISIAIKLGEQWFISHECGANFYLGYGPKGILELRKACHNSNIPIFVLEDDLQTWLLSQELKTNALGNNSLEGDFNIVVNIFRNMTADFQRRPIEYQGIHENSIRDRLLAPINGALFGRAHAESKNVKGKTDILVRSKEGSNEIIFELKVWKGPESFNQTIVQLQGYLQPNNNYCGIIILCYVKDFTKIFHQSFEHVKKTHRCNVKNIIDGREFTFYLNHSSDSIKEIEVKAIFVNLCE
jgi:hypothetical protein